VATQQLEDLKLSEQHAEAIIEKGIEYGAYSDEMPDSKKDKIAAAEDIITFSIDAYVNDGITSDDEDPQVAESGEQIEEILAIAGIEIEDGEPVFGDLPDLDDDNGGDSKGDGEEPFNPDDYIEGYSELSVVSKLKAVKGLDVNDDDEVAILEAIYDWENEQEKPSSRVLNYVDETLGEPESDEKPAKGKASAKKSEPEDDDNGGDDDGEEPWPGYDKATATDIKKVLKEALDDDELTAEQVEYVLEYEQGREKPPTRKRIVDYCNALLEELAEGGSKDDEPEPEKPTRRRGRGSVKTADKAPKSDNGVIVLTREQILTALDSGEVTIEI
jgi:hypothetical protein